MPVFPKRKISNWIKQITAKYDKRVGEVAYIFCSNKKIEELNTQYLSHKSFTDIITFDYTDSSRINGDIFISIETVRNNAKEYKVSYKNELYRVMIHGILHLCGKKDKTAYERNEMERFENEALDTLFAEEK